MTGSGFTTNGDASDVKLGNTSIAGGNASYTVDSNTQITITGAGTDFTNQNVVVVDAAGTKVQILANFLPSTLLDLISLVFKVVRHTSSNQVQRFK